MTSVWVAPTQRRMATLSQWRAAKRRAAMATPDPGQDHADQRRQIQKALRPFQRQPQFGAGIAHALQLLAGLQPGLRPGLEIRQRRRLAGQQQPVFDPAARLHQFGRGHVGQIHQQPGGDAEQIAGPVRFVGQHLIDAETADAEVQRTADVQVQGLRQPLVQPDLAGLRDRGGQTGRGERSHR